MTHLTHLTDLQIAQVAHDAGFTGSGLVTAVAVALAESGGQSAATNTVGNSHGTDRGLWQINSYYHPEVSDAQAFAPQQCANAAFRISDGGRNWRPWSTFNNGSVIKYVTRGRVAAAIIGSHPLQSDLGQPVLARTLRLQDPRMTGPDVHRLQHQLHVPEDGIYGPVTCSAVQVFQHRHALTVDGIVGPATAAALSWTWTWG